MATYWCTQAGAGAEAGTSIGEAWSLATLATKWGTLDNDSANILYLSGTFTGNLNIATFTSTGFTIDGAPPGETAATFDIAGSETYCIRTSSKVYDAAAPLTVKNITVGDSTSTDIYILSSNYVNVENITAVAAGTADYGIQVAGTTCTGVQITDCTVSGYPESGIDVVAGGANTLDGVVITDCTSGANTKYGIKLRATGTSTISDATITGCTANTNGQSGIEVVAAGGCTVQNVVIDNCDVHDNGATLYGTGIEIYGTDATGTATGITIKGCRTSGTLDADSDGSDGVGIRFDDFVSNSYIYGCKSTDDVTGFVMKNTGNRCSGNIAIDSTSRGFRYATNVAGVSTDAEYINNTAIGCAIGFEDVNAAADGAEVYNNIWLNCTEGMRVNSGSTITEEYNLFYGCTYNYRDTTDTPVALDATDLTSDPLLTSDYHPTVNSPCFAAGKIIFGARDFNGRPCKYPPTIGAYQFNAGAPAQTRTAATTRTART